MDGSCPLLPPSRRRRPRARLRPQPRRRPGRGLRPPSLALASSLIVAALLAAGCGTDADPASTDAGVLVVTTSIWADVVSNVACDGGVEIETVMPIGADAHSFEPSLADRRRFDGALLIVSNGLRLELGLLDTIAEAETAGTPVLRLATHMPTIPYAGQAGQADQADQDVDHDHEATETDHDHQDDGADHDHEGDDPHVWLDPMRVSGVAPVLADLLVDHADLDRDVVDACVTDFQGRLADLDREIAARVADLPVERRLLVTNHDTLGYFADRYGFEVIGTVSASPAGPSETNPADLEALALVMEAFGSRTIFAETTASVDEAEALARRLGNAEVVTLFTGSLGESGGGTGTYLDFLTTNTDRILDALS